MTVGKAIFYLLDNSTDLTAIVGTRIYPEVAQQDAPLPYVVYNISNNEPSDTKREPSKMDTANIEVNCYSTSYTQVIDMSVAVRAALDRVTGTYSGVNVQSIAYMNEVIDFDEGQRAYNVSSDYDVRISRTDFEIAQGSPITGVDLGDLADVNTTGVTNGQVIAYDAATAVWLPATDAGGAEQLNDLSDVIISQPSTGEFFRYDGGEWVNDSAQKSDVGLGNVDNTSDANKPVSTATQTALDLKADITSVPTELDDLNDVQIIGTPTLGQALVYGAGKWLPGAAGATDLGDLDDVNTTGAAFGSLLTYNGASWDISGSQLPTDDIYFHQRYETESEALRTGATATTELYFTCTAQGNGLAESASSDTPTAGKIIRRKIYYSDAGFADPDTGTWVEFTPAPADDAAFATVKAALLENLKARTGGTVPISLKQTWEEVTAAPTFTGLLNETYGSGAAAAYGTRRLNGNYSGACMTIRRTDGTTQTIGFVGEEIDESAITNFCTGSTCTVQVWHDQSQTGGTGSGNDAEQTTPANQPTIYTGGQLVKDGGRLALDFDGTTDFLQTSTAYDTQQYQSTFYIASSTATNQRVLDTRGTGASVQGWHCKFSNPLSDTSLIDSGTGTFLQSSVTRTGQNLASVLMYGGSGSSIVEYSNGVLSDSVSDATTRDFDSGNVLTIGANSNGQNTQIFDGTLQEIVLYNSDKSANRTDIEGNISAYYQSAKLLDESYGSGAEAAYSVRQLKRANTECMVIRRASDSTTTTIGFDGSGNISEADIISFCTGTSCTVETWKDQSGNGNDATAPSTGAEPTIYTGGALVKENGKLALDFDGGDGLSHTSDLSLSACSIFTTLEATNATRVWYGESESNYLATFAAYIGCNANNVQRQALNTPSNQTLYNFTRDGSVGGTWYKNGTALTSTGSQTNETLLLNSLGGFSPFRHIGAFQEMIVYPTDKTGTDQTSIEENVGDYFTQNTPLLDTYSGAAAAYSLRLLDSTYTGALIRVRRSSDNTELDINSNVFGELDTVSLLDFAGTGDAFVKTWYDQSGNSNDATQTVTGNQPQIVSSGAVIVENGKPAVEFNGTSSTMSAPASLTNAVTIFVVYRRETTTGNYILDGQSSTRLAVGGVTAGNQFQVYVSSAVGGLSDILSQQNLGYVLVNATNSAVALNGGTATTGSSGNAVNTSKIWIGSRLGGSGFMQGKQQEVIYFDADESANRTGIETNVNTFYNIY